MKVMSDGLIQKELHCKGIVYWKEIFDFLFTTLGHRALSGDSLDASMYE